MDEETQHIARVSQLMADLRSLYEDAHPGLITWQIAVRDAERALADALIHGDPRD